MDSQKRDLVNAAADAHSDAAHLLALAEQLEEALRGLIDRHPAMLAGEYGTAEAFAARDRAREFFDQAGLADAFDVGTNLETAQAALAGMIHRAMEIVEVGRPG
jgi:hypothetical protein